MRINTSSSLQVFAALILAGALGNAALWGQTFNSGSTGSDGSLSFPNAQPGQTIVFDPNTFTPPLNPAHDNIFNFTTITIPQGVTIRLSAQNLGGPIYWLASGAVDIEGTLDLSGSPGHAATNVIALRIPSIPGAGGFSGGVGGGPPGSAYPVEAGQGPGGGVPCQNGGSNTYFGGGGAFTGNQFLVPLIGGSGGAGDSGFNGTFGSGGGAGGGAILIASSVSITIKGTITGAGGKSGDYGQAYAGGGAGGAIRLVAPTILGNGSISVVAGNQSTAGACQTVAQNGLARLEAFNQLFSGSISGAQSSGSPYNTFVPNGTTPKLTVVSVNGVAVAPNPLGNFTNPDVTFSAPGAVPVVINGTNIPVATKVSLQIYSENGPDIVMQNAGALSGTTASSTVTIMVNLPPGFSRGFISASFTP